MCEKAGLLSPGVNVCVEMSVAYLQVRVRISLTRNDKVFCHALVSANVISVYLKLADLGVEGTADDDFLWNPWSLRLQRELI